MDFKNIMDHVFQSSVVKPFEEAHSEAFLSRVPEEIKEKLNGHNIISEVNEKDNEIVVEL